MLAGVICSTTRERSSARTPKTARGTRALQGEGAPRLLLRPGGFGLAAGPAFGWNAGMSENEPEKPKKGWGCLQWGVVVALLCLLGLYLTPSYGRITPRANQMKGSNNARQITGLLLTYAAEYGGHYPDHGKDHSKLTSNEVFRLLVQDGLVQDETIFNCPGSSFRADKIIGEAPDFKQTLLPGENHWMFTAGLGNTSPAYYPVIMENAVQPAWPPKWSSYSKTVVSFFSSSEPDRLPGAAWKDGKIIVAFNDASVLAVSLDSKDGLLQLPDSVLKPEGKTPLPELKILDVE